MTKTDETAVKAVGTSIYDTFETDDAKEKSGIWLEFGIDTRICIARAGGANSRFAKVLEAKSRPYRRLIEQNALDPKVADKMLVDTLAETVVLGWEGVRDREGVDIAFSVANVKALFTELPDLFVAIRESAMQASNFRRQDIEDDAGN